MGFLLVKQAHREIRLAERLKNGKLFRLASFSFCEAFILRGTTVSRFQKEVVEVKVKLLKGAYSILLEWETKDEEVKSVMIKWAQDIGHNILLEDWERVWKTDLKFTVCSLLKENYMKMMYRWYITSVKIARMYKTGLNICWKCKEQEGTFYLMWWDCREILKNWEMIYELKKMFQLPYFSPHRTHRPIGRT